MGSTATIVSKRVPVTLLGSCISKPAGEATTMVPLARLRRHSAPSIYRPFYTRTHDFSSLSSISEVSSSLMSPKMTEFAHQPALNVFLPPRAKEPKEIVFLGGAPGAGKGTNSVLVSNLRGFDAPPIVVSELLNTPACKLMKDQGVMVNDEFVFNALLKELEKPIYRNGVVVDGFPRTAKQAQFLADHYHNDSPVSPQVSFVMLHVDEDASIRRQQERGKVTMALNKERAAKNMSPIEVRATDINPEASKVRYDVFKEQLNAVMGLSRQFPLVVVDATPSLDVVRNNLTAQMGALPPKQKKNLPKFSF